MKKYRGEKIGMKKSFSWEVGKIEKKFRNEQKLEKSRVKKKDF